MIFLINKRYRFILSLVITLLISSCTERKTIGSGTTNPQEYELVLDSIIEKFEQIDASENPIEFISLYDQIQNIINLLPDTSKVYGHALNECIAILNKAGGYKEAIKLCRKLIRYNRSVNIHDSITSNIQVYGMMANSFQGIGMLDSTAYVYQRVIKEIKQLPDKSHLAPALNNYGMHFFDHGFVDSALFYYQMSDSILRVSSVMQDYDYKFHGSVKDNLATIYEINGDFAGAKEVYEENFMMYEKTVDHFRWINAGISLANAELELGNLDRVKDLLDSINSISDTLQYHNKHTNELFMSEVYVKLFSKNGNFREALKYQQRAGHLSDSLMYVEKKVHDVVSGLLAGYTSDKFGYLMKIEKARREKEEQRSRMRLLIIILIAIGAIFTPTILYYYYKQRIRLHAEKTKSHLSNRLLAEEKLKTRNQEKKLLDTELENKKKDLTDMALSLSQKKQHAKELYSKVVQIENLRGKHKHKELQDLKEELRSQQYVDSEMEHLQQNIDILSSAFYDKLNMSFPGLSKTEVKLSSFIKLNLSTSQISQLQNISSKSVIMSRYRLKKKLGLDTDQNLDEFLQSF